jgi:hypothetical protein
MYNARNLGGCIRDSQGGNSQIITNAMKKMDCSAILVLVHEMEIESYTQGNKKQVKT